MLSWLQTANKWFRRLVGSGRVWRRLVYVAMRLHNTARPYVFYHLPADADSRAARVWSRWRGLAGPHARPPCPRRWPSVRRRSVGPSWDLDKQPFVFVDAFVSPSAARPTASTQPRRPTLFLTYLFSAPAHRLIPLLCAFYFTQRSRSKWRKAIVDRCSVRQLSTPSYRVADEEELHTGGVLAYEFYRALFCNAVEQSSIHENRSSFDKRGSARRETLAMLSVGFCGSLV